MSGKMITEAELVRADRQLSAAIADLQQEMEAGKMNISAALARVGTVIGPAVYGLAVEHVSERESHTFVTWSRSGQEPQRVRKTLTDRLRMGGILQVECDGEIQLPLNNSVVEFPIRTEDGTKTGSLTAFVEHHCIEASHCRLLCDLATLFSIRLTTGSLAR
ncbi:MAG: hypothetical protein R2832_10675 [Rhodothermales bacterium]